MTAANVDLIRRKALLAVMKAEQAKLIDAAAAVGGLPTDGALRKIADLEVAMGALENLIEDVAEQ